MNKEEIEKVINYNYAEFGNEFGDAIVDLKNELDKSNEKLEKIEKLLADNEHTKVNDEDRVIVFYTNLKEIIKGSVI